MPVTRRRNIRPLLAVLVALLVTAGTARPADAQVMITPVPRGVVVKLLDQAGRQIDDISPGVNADYGFGIDNPNTTYAFLIRSVTFLVQTTPECAYAFRPPTSTRTFDPPFVLQPGESTSNPDRPDRLSVADGFTFNPNGNDCQDVRFGIQVAVEAEPLAPRPATSAQVTLNGRPITQAPAATPLGVDASFTVPEGTVAVTGPARLYIDDQPVGVPVTVGADGSVHYDLPQGLSPGRHRVLVVVDDPVYGRLEAFTVVEIAVPPSTVPPITDPPGTVPTTTVPIATVPIPTPPGDTPGTPGGPDGVGPGVPPATIGSGSRAATNGPGPGGSLPTTGSSLTGPLVASGGLLVLAGGAVTFVALRRRRRSDTRKAPTGG